MTRPEILALYDQDQRIEVEYPDARREQVGTVVRHVSLTGTEGAVLYSRLDGGTVEPAIREQVAYFDGIGQDFEWKVFDHDPPPDLKDRLVAHGFEIEEAEAIMVLDLAEVPEILRQAVQQPIRRITTPEGIADVIAVEEQVWQEAFAELKQYLTQTLSHRPEQMSIYAAYLDGQPVSTAWIYFPPASRFASLWGGSTLSEYRSRGLYTALLAVRVQEALERRVDFLTVDASPMSRPILEKFGFKQIATAYPCKWHRKVK